MPKKLKKYEITARGTVNAPNKKEAKQSFLEDPSGADKFKVITVDELGPAEEDKDTEWVEFVSVSHISGGRVSET